MSRKSVAGVKANASCHGESEDNVKENEIIMANQ
jgi:hypothetical protein